MAGWGGDNEGKIAWLGKKNALPRREVAQATGRDARRSGRRGGSSPQCAAAAGERQAGAD